MEPSGGAAVLLTDVDLRSLLELWEWACHGEDVEVGRVGQQSGSWKNSIQWVVAVQLAGGSLTCSAAGGNCLIF